MLVGRALAITPLRRASGSSLSRGSWGDGAPPAADARFADLEGLGRRRGVGGNVEVPAVEGERRGVGVAALCHVPPDAARQPQDGAVGSRRECVYARPF